MADHINVVFSRICCGCQRRFVPEFDGHRSYCTGDCERHARQAQRWAERRLESLRRNWQAER